MKLIPTSEQELILANAEEGRNLAISALAGTAKTSTCVMIAKKLRKPSLYVSYNKAIAVEAQGKFPPLWVECKTMHSVAWQAVVKRTGYVNKLKGYIDRNDILQVLPELRSRPYSARIAETNFISDKLGKFFNSSETSIQTFCDSLATSATRNKNIRRVWEAMLGTKNPMGITHDTYLKIFQMSKPNLGYDIIYLDECQDANPVILDILLRQDCQKILVGDPHQAIYGWRDTVNAFEELDDSFSILELTTSFRFGFEIANKANRVLSIMDESSSRLVGAGKNTKIESKAILVRSNLDLFSHMSRLARDRAKIYVIGDLGELFKQLYSASNLKHDGDKSKRLDKLVASYDTWEQLEEDKEATPELAKLVSIVNNFPALHKTILTVKANLVQTEQEADITLVTAHKSKGLEFDHVTISKGFIHWTALRDFKKRLVTAQEVLETDETGNLIYVALTRAKVELELPEDLKTILDIRG